TDDVMRLFGSERVINMMETLGVDEDTPLDHKMLSGAIEQAQKTVESRNFQTRKSVLEYDDVMNKQRNIIYDERRKVLDGEDLREQIKDMIREFVESTVRDGLAGGSAENQQHLDETLAPFERLFLRRGAIRMESFKGAVTSEELAEAVLEIAGRVYAEREAGFGEDPNGNPLMREIERVVMLRVVDEYWMDHIDAMTELKRGIGLRGYGNVKPIDAYKREGFEMFEAMINGIREETVRRIFTIRVRREQPIQRRAVAKNAAANVGGPAQKKKPVKKAPKPGRNDPCPCGKMKEDGSRRLKYKECCGRNN
ncbi:MAG: preprotein translocase subunit SecA, partial [Clostridia bacterium]|nr:preprotein translocase subunit SecA [Clostridia bacterium]